MENKRTIIGLFLFILFVFTLCLFSLDKKKPEIKIEYYKNGKIKAKGEIKNGKKNGFWIGWHKNWGANV